MSKAEPDGSFWTSLPGILTGIAAIITAVGGLIGVWHQWMKPAEQVSPPVGVEQKDVADPNRSGSETSASGAPETSKTRSGRDGGDQDAAANELREAVSATEPGAPIEATAARDGEIEKGDAVLAEWKDDGCLYPGDVRQVKGGQYRVYFGFDQEVWIAPEGVVKPVTPTAASVSPGVRVYAEVEDVRTRWIPSTVRDIRDERYYVVFDESADCRPRDKRHVWVGVDRIVLSD